MPQIPTEQDRMVLRDRMLNLAAARMIWTKENERNADGIPVREAKELHAMMLNEMRSTIATIRSKGLDVSKYEPFVAALASADPKQPLPQVMESGALRGDVIEFAARPGGMNDMHRERVAKAMGVPVKHLPHEAREMSITDAMKIQRMALGVFGSQVAASRATHTPHGALAGEFHSREAKQLTQLVDNLKRAGFDISSQQGLVNGAVSQAYKIDPLPANRSITLGSGVAQTIITPQMQDQMTLEANHRMLDHLEQMKPKPPGGRPAPAMH